MIKTADFESGGKRYRLRFDVNALADVEKEANVGFGQIMKMEYSFHLVRLLLWAGLKWEIHGLTVERAGNILSQFITSGGDLGWIGDKIGEAIQLSGLFKEEDEAGGDDDPNMTAEAAN